MTRVDTGILIAVEGIDGAGKTTQVGLLEEFLTSAGESVVRSREPTNGPWGKAIRESVTKARMPLSDDLVVFVSGLRKGVSLLYQSDILLGRRAHLCNNLLHLGHRASVLLFELILRPPLTY